MQSRASRGLLLVSTLVCLAAGYYWLSRPDSAPQPPPERTAEAGALPGPAKLAASVVRMREKLRNAPGRTGILAETKLYSFFDEELIIRDFFQDREGGFFVDVGCAWPVMANNTFYLEKHLGWKGIAIDALPDYAPAWQEERPATRFLSYLVTDHSGTEDSFFRSESVGLSSAERTRADGGHFGDTLAVEEIRIPSTTLDDLLSREGVTKIDLLAMDIEGHELKALHGFDIDRFRPELVVTEGKRLGVAAYMDEHGYELIERYRPFDFVNSYYRRRAGASGSP